MKQPRTTRKQRQAAAANDTAIMDVSTTVKKFAGVIVQALDVFTKRGLDPQQHVIVFAADGNDFTMAVKERDQEVLKLGVLPCGHVMLIVSLPSGVQGCCPECDYDVRGRKTN